MIRTFALTTLLMFSTTTGLFAWDWSDLQKYRENFRFSYRLLPGSRVSLDSLNGNVEIIAWDRNEIEISGSRYAADEQVMKNVKVEIRNADDFAEIRTIKPLERNCRCGATYMLRVPRKVLLDTISTSNGSLKVDGTQGAARLRTSNGSVRLSNTTGDGDVDTSNGAVTLTNAKGDLRVNTSNGSISGDVTGSLNADTSNGSITMRVRGTQANKPLVVDSSNGSINLDIEGDAPQAMEITTSNSSVTLRMPASTNAELRANTSNGTITTDFEVRARGSISKTRVEGSIGAGGQPIRVSTSNGSIRLLRL
jgi:DUF4097 and DUF4098 domain-containing protein YvlB